jgi:hypothetical protein
VKNVCKYSRSPILSDSESAVYHVPLLPLAKKKEGKLKK